MGLTLRRPMLYDLLGLSEAQFVGFLLSFLRIMALVAVAPVLGSQSIPVQVKVFFSFFLSIMLLPMLKTDTSLTSLSLIGMLPLALKEMLVGLFLGFNAKFIFESFQFAGRLISTQMGLGMANIIDPENGAPSTPIGNIYSMVVIILFLTLNGHHFVIAALYKSFEFVPVASMSLIPAAAHGKMLVMFNNLFIMGIKLAAPSMATLFLIEVCMAIMARIMPQMNIFFIGLPIRLSVGMFIVIVSLPLVYVFFTMMLRQWERDLTSILNHL
ncbi:MAG: flagellar biosynthetic protein FliR [Caldithrix sp.]|nr:MAG: flagellar biosynthetic protein FliR [Caldithrix sp.]